MDHILFNKRRLKINSRWYYPYSYRRPNKLVFVAVLDQVFFKQEKTVCLFQVPKKENLYQQFLMDIRQSNLIRNFKVRKLTQSYDINACIQNKKDQRPQYTYMFTSQHTHTQDPKLLLIIKAINMLIRIFIHNEVTGKQFSARACI